MFLGAPMVPVILLAGATVLIGMLGLFVNLLVPLAIVPVTVPIYAWMRVMTKADDQRLSQLILRIRLRTRMAVSSHAWGAITYVPLTYKKR
jgi:type IV secretion system protein VirB3